MRTALAATIILVFMWSAPAIADEVRILSSPGGQVGPFLDLFEGVRKMWCRTIGFASPAGQCWVFTPRVR
jgi:hypothetical protein